MRDFIKSNYNTKEYKWEPLVVENKCIPKPWEKPKSASDVELNPTQKFITTYFCPESPYKGLLLWHSVGTGKTCSGVSIASTTFEKAGYSILWVTRTKLKSDVWKNIFDQICLSAQKIIENFNLKNGPLLIQGIIKDDDFFVLEFSPRIGGGSKNQFVHTLTENNMMQLYLNQCLNKNKIIIKKEKKYHSALMKYYYFNGSYYKETKNIKRLLKEKVILKSFFYKNNKTPFGLLT